MARSLVTKSAGALLALTFLVGAFGGDDKGDEKSSDEPTTDEVADALDNIDEDNIDDVAEAAGIDEDCLAVALEVQQTFAGLGTASTDPSSIKAYAETFANLGDRLPELDAEFDVVADAFTKFSDGDTAALESAEYQAASAKIGDFFDDQCSAE